MDLPTPILGGVLEQALPNNAGISPWEAATGPDIVELGRQPKSLTRHRLSKSVIVAVNLQ